MQSNTSHASIVVHLHSSPPLQRHVRVPAIQRLATRRPASAKVHHGSPVVVAAIWRSLLEPEGGLANRALASLGVDGPAWLRDPSWVLPSFVLMSVWSVGAQMLVFLAALQAIDPAAQEAARVDGAGFWGIFLRVLVPMSLPIFAVAMILQITGIWNDFLFGVVFTRPEYYPMTVQLNNIVNSVQGVKEYNVNMAATLLTGAVPLIVYFVWGRLFVRGIAAGAVKG